jgi:serine/threonine protein kinase
VKLIDFGIARDRAAPRLTWTKLSSTMGTPAHLAPEQIAGRRGDERSDIYATGMILYEMLTGRLPFSGSNAHAVMRARTGEEPRPPTYFAPCLDQALSAIICRAIALVPGDRYQSAAELRDRLRRPHEADDSAAANVGTGMREGRVGPARLAMALVLAALTSLTWLSHRADTRAPPSESSATLGRVSTARAADDAP